MWFVHDKVIYVLLYKSERKGIIYTQFLFISVIQIRVIPHIIKIYKTVLSEFTDGF